MQDRETSLSDYSNVSIQTNLPFSLPLSRFPIQVLKDAANTEMTRAFPLGNAGGSTRSITPDALAVQMIGQTTLGRFQEGFDDFDDLKASTKIFTENTYLHVLGAGFSYKVAASDAVAHHLTQRVVPNSTFCRIVAAISPLRPLLT